MKIAALLILVSWAAVAPLGAQNRRVVGVIGAATAGTSFTMRIVGSAFTRDIHFTPLPTDYAPLALAQLMVSSVNADFRANGNMGFEASNPVNARDDVEFDATFVLTSTTPISQIMVGVYGMPTSPLPRPPGVAFNPNFFDATSNVGGAFVEATQNHPNATFRINGRDPGQDFNHVVKVVLDPQLGGPLTLGFSSGPNPGAGFMLLFGAFAHGVFPLAFGGTLDLGSLPSGTTLPVGVSILADGIFSQAPPFGSMMVTGAGNPATKAFTLIVPPSFAGVRGDAFQAIMTDPTVTTAPYRITAAGQPWYEIGRDDQLPIPSDGFIPIGFVNDGVNPATYTHFGVTYQQMFAHENGLLTFSAVPASTVSPHPIAFNNTVPAIFVNWADWDLSSLGTISVFQFRDELRVQWGRPGAPVRHAGDNDAARFESVMRLAVGPLVSLDANSVALSFRALDPLALTRNDGVMGITGGVNIGLPAVSEDLGRPVFAGLLQGISAPLASILSQSASSTTPSSTLPIDGAGTPQLYSNGSNWRGRSVTFFPPAGGSGVHATRHYSIPTNQNRDDFIAAAGAAVLRRTPTTAGQTIVLIGYFRFLQPLLTAGTGFVPQVLLDPLGSFGAPIPLTITGVMDDPANPELTNPPTLPLLYPPGFSLPLQPGFRPFEGVVTLHTSPLPPSYVVGATIDVGVVFPSGMILVPNALTVVP